MFRLGRPDVLPIHDYGVQKGFALTYGKQLMPKPQRTDHLRRALAPVSHGGQLVHVACRRRRGQRRPQDRQKERHRKEAQSGEETLVRPSPRRTA